MGPFLVWHVPICYTAYQARRLGCLRMPMNDASRGDCDQETARRTAASRIFETARNLFYQRGVRAVGVDEIVCEAGVTKPSLYRAFKSKDDLVAACLTENAKEGVAALEAVLDAAGPDPLARMNALVRYYAAKIDSPDFRGCLMSNIAVELAEPGHPGREIVQGCKTNLRALITGLARDLPASDPEALADSLLLTIEGAFATYHIFGSRGPSRSLVATCDALVAAYSRR